MTKVFSLSPLESRRWEEFLLALHADFGDRRFKTKDICGKISAGEFRSVLPERIAELRGRQRFNQEVGQLFLAVARNGLRLDGDVPHLHIAGTHAGTVSWRISMGPDTGDTDIPVSALSTEAAISANLGLNELEIKEWEHFLLAAHQVFPNVFTAKKLCAAISSEEILAELPSVLRAWKSGLRYASFAQHVGVALRSIAGRPFGTSAVHVERHKRRVTASKLTGWKIFIGVHPAEAARLERKALDLAAVEALLADIESLVGQWRSKITTGTDIF